jgi:hypothetical protein
VAGNQGNEARINLAYQDVLLIDGEVGEVHAEPRDGGVAERLDAGAVLLLEAREVGVGVSDCGQDVLALTMLILR